MILFKIFKFRKLYKEFKEDPAKASGAELVDMLREIILIPKIIALVILVIFFILGFTSLLSGPMLFFKILFWFFLFLYFIFIIASRIFLSYLQKKVESVAKDLV